MNISVQKLIGISLIVIGLTFAVYVLAKSIFFPTDLSRGSGTASTTAGEIIPPQITAKDVDPSEYPSSLIIPKIGVDASVQHVGVKENGDMANPTNFTDVGWYKDGIVPGYEGSSVIAGHVDNALALSGVFKQLSTLKNGDEVYIENRNGEKHLFKVEKIETYNYKSA
ncbi:MAG: class F sortase, partial [Minisyncoccota bacterium]